MDSWFLFFSRANKLPSNSLQILKKFFFIQVQINSILVYFCQTSNDHDYFLIFRDYHSNTLQEKEVDDNESEIGSSQPHSSRGVLVEDKEILLVSEVEEDDDIEEFDDD